MSFRYSDSRSTVSRRTLILAVALSLGSGLVGGLAGAWLTRPEPPAVSQRVNDDPPAIAVRSELPPVAAASSADFVQASRIASPSVVFIKTLSNVQSRSADPFWDFWDFWGGMRRGPIANAGSGVVISPDGYIVTNNHVVDKADKIEVIFPNKHSYLAEVVGTDPNTDLAVLKIEAKNLKAATLGNSDQVQIGEWVLALGNPLNLTYTVTAGIVSARGRNINIVNSQFPMESFIQTDAAINPGNSGGALVNLRGELIGINTAIASKTGAYSGYGFAIPSNIVRKVSRDLIEYGEVQISFLGAEVLDIDSNLADKISGDDYSGVYVYNVERDGSAARAGLREGDVILAIEGISINSKAEYLERLAHHRPGENIRLSIRRDNKLMELRATLFNKEGTTSVLKTQSVWSSDLGCRITPLSKVERNRLNTEGGYRLTELRSGTIAQMGLPEGFVLISVNKQVPRNPQELIELLSRARGRVIIEGIPPGGSRSVYSFRFY